MPSGIIMSSGSVGATQEAIEDVLQKNGYESDKPEPVEPVAPKAEDFTSDEEFEKAQEEFEAKQEEIAAKKDEEEAEKEEERQRKQEDRHPHLSRRQRAIESATKPLKEQLAKAEKDRKALEDRLAALEGKVPKKEEPKIEAPKREQFKSDDEFEEAKFQHRYKLQKQKDEQEAARKAADAAAKKNNERLQQNFEAYQASVAEHKEDFPDWEKVVGSSAAISEAVYFSILELRDEGYRVTYYLGKHPDVLERLNELSHHSAAMEVARLFDKLKTSSANRGDASGGNGTRKAAPKKLPEPVVPLSSSASTSTLSSREAAKKGDFRAFKQAQRRGV